MKFFMAWIYAVVCILLGIIPFVIGFLIYPIKLGFVAGMEANELLHSKTDKIMKSLGK